MATSASVPIWGDEIRDFINLGTADEPKWQEVTHLLNWEHSNDSDAYEPEYLDTKQRPSFTRSRSNSTEYENDAYKNDPFTTYLIEHRNESNISTEIVTVYTWITAEEGADPFAEKAAFSLNPNRVGKGSAGEPAKLTGTLNMTDEDWLEGTFDLEALSFTATAKTDGTTPKG